MFIINIALSNYSIVTMKGIPTVIDQQSIMATLRRMSMMIYSSPKVKFVMT